MQNSGVIVDANSDHFCSALDNNPIRASMPYFGVIEQIWKLDYSEFRVHVFKFKWVNDNTDVRQDQLEFTLVDLNKMAYMDEPFIMVEQAKKVFYIQDPCNSRFLVVLQGRPSSFNHPHDDSTLDIYETPAFSIRMPSINESHNVDDVHANRNEHDEGLWENILVKSSFMMMNQAILMMPKAQVIDSRLQDQASRI